MASASGYKKYAAIYILVAVGTTGAWGKGCPVRFPPTQLTPILSPDEASFQEAMNLSPSVLNFDTLRFRNSDKIMFQVDDFIMNGVEVKSIVLENISIDVLAPPGIVPLTNQKIVRLRIVRCIGLHALAQGTEALGFSNTSLPDLEVLEVISSPLFYVTSAITGLGGGVGLRKVVIKTSQVIWMESFAEHERLEWMSLEGNHFRSLNRAQFPSNAEKLWYLNLSRNKLTSLTELKLDEFMNLKELHLQENGLVNLDGVQRISQLQELWIGGNDELPCQDLCWLRNRRNWLSTGRLSSGLGWTAVKCNGVPCPD